MNNITHVDLPVSRSEKFFSVFSRSIVTLREEYKATLLELRNSETKLQEISNKLKSSSEANIKLTEKVQTFVKSFRDLKIEYEQAVTEVEVSQKNLTLLKSKLEKANATLDSTKELLISEKDQSAALQSRYDLMCAAISPTRHKSERYTKFNKLLNESLLPFINRVNVLPNEAEQVMKIKTVDDELRLADSLAAFSERTIVAVAGGFSSGKSSLITSLFAEENVSLPIGIDPVTAIPTYVFHSDTVAISGYPKDGGHFNVPRSVYARLSHQFVEEFGFNLRDLLPFMSLEVPMKSYRNLSFIDLPGYNPGARGGSTEGDESASDEFVTKGQALIWVIGLDANGTLPSDDLDRLWELSELNIPIYVVLNKADLRPVDTLDNVMDQVVDELELNGIAYEGVCAYSSECAGEISFRERSLWDVLTEWDKPIDALGTVVEKLIGVFEDYETAIRKDIKERESKASLVKGLELNLLEVGAFEQNNDSSFDIQNYMENDDDSEVTGSTVGSILRNHMMNIYSGKEKASKKDRSEEIYEEVYEEDETNCRSDLINLIRDQIQILREDYSIEQSLKNLEDLFAIRRNLEEIFGM